MSLDRAPSKVWQAAVWRPILAVTLLAWGSLGSTQEAGPDIATQAPPAAPAPQAPTPSPPTPLYQTFSVPGGASIPPLRCAAPQRPPQASARAAEGGAAPAGSEEEELPLTEQQERQLRLEALPAPTLDDIKKSMPHEEWLQVMHQRIREVASQRVARIGVWGGSHMAAEFFVGQLRKQWQGRYGDGGAGHMNLLYGLPGIRLPVNALCRQGRWQHDLAPRATGSAPLTAGLGLFAMSNREAGAAIEIDPGSATGTPVRTVTLQYLRQPEAGVIDLVVDDVLVGLIDTNGPLAVGSVQVQSANGISRIRLVAHQTVTLLGAYAEAERGVVLDNFGIAGASGSFWTTVRSDLMQQAAQQRPYELVMLAYGTNDVTGAQWDPIEYRRKFEATLESMRQAMPQAMCVLIPPGDRVTSVKVRSVVRGKNGKTRKVVQTRYDLKTFPQRHMETTRIQREVGERHQCVTWDMSLEMRKAGGAYALMKKNPPWMARDLIHLTPLGYQEMARAYAKWLRL
jgi:lysophospholipase L1-like esterase